MQKTLGMVFFCAFGTLAPVVFSTAAVAQSAEAAAIEGFNVAFSGGG